MQCGISLIRLIRVEFQFKVLLGGGRGKFMPTSEKDPIENKHGQRIDDRNLIDEWAALMRQKNLKHKYLWNASELLELKPNQYDRILGW